MLNSVKAVEQTSYLDYVNALPLQEALWWFIENGNEDLPGRSEIFFSLRERMRAARSAVLHATSAARRIAGLLIESAGPVLDSVVHDECSAYATVINNGGTESQVQYLLSNGWAEAMILREVGANQAADHSLPRP